MDADSEATVETIVGEYRSNFALYKTCTDRLRELLEQLLGAAGLSDRIHSVTCRPKDVEKLREKLGREERRYAKLSDVTDLVGLRVITYFADDVDEIAARIESEFDIDLENSVDKRKALAPDRFGYLSRHFVCKLKEKRSGLPEYAAYKDMSLEIQVRSILQHAWAEIEHDLGYKSQEAIPAPMRRRFSRLAGLLEIADDEFERLRKELEEYASGISAAIERAPSVVLIDQVSLESFIQSDSLVEEIDREMASAIGAKERGPRTYSERALPLLKEMGLETVQDVRAALEEHRAPIIEEIKLRSVGTSVFLMIRSGTCLMSLPIVLAAERGSIDELRAFLEKHHVSISGSYSTALLSFVQQKNGQPEGEQPAEA